MLPRANIWLKVLPIVSVVVLIVSILSLRGLPPTNLRRYAPVHFFDGVQTSVVLQWLVGDETDRDNDAASAAWRLSLRLDTTQRRLGPAWQMYEGAKPGAGYELHWQPHNLQLTLFRAGDQSLLGSVFLDHFPSQVVFIRHGYHLLVQADDVQVLHCLDPLPTPPASAFGLMGAGPMPGSTFSLHDDRSQVDPLTLSSIVVDLNEDLRPFLEDHKRSDRAILSVRYALGIDPERAVSEVVTALEHAGAAVRELSADDPDRISLQQWLAWGEIRLALTRQDPEAPERTNAAIRQLVLLGQNQPSAENLGLLLDVLGRITEVCARPPFPYRATKEALQWRRSWFDLLSLTATRAQAACVARASVDGTRCPAVNDEWRWQLRLLMHGALCLRGPPEAAPGSTLAGVGNLGSLGTPSAASALPGTSSEDALVQHLPWPLPTPIDAQDWVISRWRAFAGNDPGSTSFPPIPASAQDLNPILPTLDRLIQIAGFEPLAAMGMRARILDALDSITASSSVEARRAAEQKAIDFARAQSVPAREGALAVALLALHGVGDPQQALIELDPDPHHTAVNADGTIPWARQNALAYALYRLLQHRLAESAPATSTAVAPAEEIPEGMMNIQVLPPAQALAATLAMQEVLAAPGEPLPDWNLLDQLPCFTLPLRLMKRSGSNSKQSTGVTNAHPIVP